MTKAISSGDARPIQAPWCVVRQQEGSYLVYNTRTDELHLIPPMGYYVYQLCDGLRSIVDLERELSPHANSNTSGIKRVRSFIQNLIDRGIVDVDGGS